MAPRMMILTVLIGGPLLGTLMGIAANPTMVPPPEPAWRKARPEPAYAQPQQIAPLGPQDLSPTWYLDRMPTWKRRAMEREAAAYAALDYAALHYAEPPAPAAPAVDPPAEPAAEAAAVPPPTAPPVPQETAAQPPVIALSAPL